LLSVLAGTAFAAQGAAQEEERWSQAELETLARRVEREVETLRGKKFVRPITVRIVNRGDLQAYVKRRWELTSSPARMAADQTIAKLLGLISPETDLLAETAQLFEEQAKGFYDPGEKSFCIMESVPRRLAGPVLSHELTHALDDQVFGLDGPLIALAENTDAAIAYLSVVEGLSRRGPVSESAKRLRPMYVRGTKRSKRLQG
jgi:hypothetical protein